MAKASLRKISIEHLRGSITPFSLPFEKGKPLTIIYGENGTGKSTICDAFEFLAKGQVGSLDGRGLGRTTKYWHSVGKKAADIVVQLESSAYTCTGKFSGSQVVVLPPESRPCVEMLRRNQILSLIQAEAAKRYQEISRFIDVTNIEKCESTLRATIDSVQKDSALAQRSVNENRTTLEQFWEGAGKQGSSAMAWAKLQENADINAWDEEITAIQQLQQKYRALLNYPQQLDNALKTFQRANENLKAAQSTMQQAVTKAIPAATETMTLLKAAQGVFKKTPDILECPLCGSKERFDGLLARISEKMGSFTVVGAAQVQVSSDEQAVNRAEQQIEIIRQNAINTGSAYIECIVGYKWPKDVPVAQKTLPDKLEEWQSWIDADSTLLQQWTDAITKRTDRKQFLSTLKKAYNTCIGNTKNADELNKLGHQLEKVLRVIEEERHKFTKQILASIATEVGRLYEKVHLGEGLNKISLSLDPKRRASLEIGTDIFGEVDMPPQAYFSDSHLDTLGICVFLALAAMENAGSKVLVLDDVLGSVDEPHVERLIEMLYEECAKFQHCIITTHYRPWKEKFRWGWLKNGQCQFVELTKWSLQKGLSSTRSIPEFERLGALLSEPTPDAQLVASKAGVILEAILTFLSQLYGCSVPHRQDNRFTLGELLPAFDKPLLKALKVEIADSSVPGTYKVVQLGPFLQELNRIAQARNVFGCHFNELSFDLLEEDAIVFGRQVFEISKVLIDSEAGWPRSKKSGSYWATNGETRRLHPLIKPN